MKGRGDKKASIWSTPTLALPHRRGRECLYKYGLISGFRNGMVEYWKNGRTKMNWYLDKTKKFLEGESE
jgi:hypothetical protein